MTTPEHQLETLSTALDAVLKARATEGGDPHALPRAEGRLMDAAIACGATLETPDYVEWAAVRVAEWLASA